MGRDAQRGRAMASGEIVQDGLRSG
jgi:hypothetical protein